MAFPTPLLLPSQDKHTQALSIPPTAHNSLETTLPYYRRVRTTNLHQGIPIKKAHISYLEEKPKTHDM